jgi:hypothetical protein
MKKKLFARQVIVIFTKILPIILCVKIVLTLRVKLPCRKILNVREIFVLSFIVSEKKRKNRRQFGNIFIKKSGR